MIRYKLRFMQCDYKVHAPYGVVIATVTFHFKGRVHRTQGKSKCPPYLFDEKTGKQLARARAERAAYIKAKDVIREMKRELEKQLAVINNSFDFFNDYINHQDNYIDTF